MKRYILILTGTLFLCACSNKKTEDDALNEILKVHDKVMAHDEQAVHNKMVLDTLYKKDAKKMEADLINRLNLADSSMEKWMQGFDPDKKGKSHEEVLHYLKTQKTAIMKVDSQLSTAINTSDAYLKTINKK